MAILPFILPLISPSFQFCPIWLYFLIKKSSSRHWYKVIQISLG
jgi:hypothetical protein